MQPFRRYTPRPFHPLCPRGVHVKTAPSPKPAALYMQGSSRLMPGGVEITSGSIVVDVQNVNDGGIYSPAGKASGQRRAQLR